MRVKELKEYLEKVPDDYIVMSDLYKNTISEEWDNTHIKSEVTVVTVKRDIEAKDYSYYDDKNNEEKWVTGIRECGGFFILCNEYKGRLK